MTLFSRDLKSEAQPTSEPKIQKGNTTVVPPVGDGRPLFTSRGLILRYGSEMTGIRATKFKNTGEYDQTTRSPLLVVQSARGEYTFDVVGPKGWAIAATTVGASAAARPTQYRSAGGTSAASAKTIEQAIGRHRVRVSCRLCGSARDERDGKSSSNGATL